MSDRRPNIVIVVADDITPSYHGCYGGPTPTPHLDRLAADGIRFARGYCAASLCCPSRFNLFTGQFAGRSPAAWAGTPAGEPYRLEQNGMLEPGQPTLARALRAAGYFTGHIGKWHSRFDTRFLGAAEPVTPAGDPDDPAVDAELRRRQAVAREVVRRTAGFEHVACVHWGNISNAVHPKLRHHNIGWMTDGALDFLDAAAGRPFYLHLANTVPHSPDCQGSLAVDHRYTWAGKLAAPPRSHPADETVPARLRAAGLQTGGPIAGVNAGAIMVDDQVGALVRRLADLGVLDNTIFIYTADHGIPGKGSCYAIGQHLPLVMRWPNGLPGGRVVHDILSWVDVVPTLAAACGVPLAADHRPDGVDLLPALRGAQPWPRAAAFHEMGWSRAVIRGRYQLIATRYPQSALAEFAKGDQARVKPGIGVMFDPLNAPFLPGYFDPDQLYDLETDPYQRHNLVADPGRAAVMAELRAELRRVTATLPRPFPERPDPFLASPAYLRLLAARREEMAAIKHYPAGDAPRVWHANLHDPEAGD